MESVEYTAEGPVIHVSGVDMRDNTPIFDIKPYLAYADAHSEASDGFAGTHMYDVLEVEFPEALLKVFPEDKRAAATEVLRQDPRPHYQDDPERLYGVSFAGFDIKFKVNGNVLTVSDVVRL